MIKFGTLKSRIEKKLLESYSLNTFKNEVKTFKESVLSNKKIAKLYFHYDELTSKKGLTESESKEFINETLSLIKKIKLTESDIKDIRKWTSSIRSKNDYKIIDDLISENVDVQKIVTLKSKLSNDLQKSSEEIKTRVNVPLHSMVNIANQTLNKYLDTLTESEKKEFNSITKLKDNEIVDLFIKNKEEVSVKLKSHLTENLEEESNKKILVTIDSIKDKEINRLELFKLINLNNSL